MRSGNCLDGCMRDTSAPSCLPAPFTKHPLRTTCGQCTREEGSMIRQAISLRSASVIALSVVACGTDVTGLTQGVVLLTDAREYQLPPPGQPPTSILGTISNQTFAGVPVRRCLIRGSAVDPVGFDLVFEKAQSDGTWQAVNLGFNCLSSVALRADSFIGTHVIALMDGYEVAV